MSSLTDTKSTLDAMRRGTLKPQIYKDRDEIAVARCKGHPLARVQEEKRGCNDVVLTIKKTKKTVCASYFHTPRKIRC